MNEQSIINDKIVQKFAGLSKEKVEMLMTGVPLREVALADGVFKVLGNNNLKFGVNVAETAEMDISEQKPEVEEFIDIITKPEESKTEEIVEEPVQSELVKEAQPEIKNLDALESVFNEEIKSDENQINEITKVQPEDLKQKTEETPSEVEFEEVNMKEKDGENKPKPPLMKQVAGAPLVTPNLDKVAMSGPVTKEDILASFGELEKKIEILEEKISGMQDELTEREATISTLQEEKKVEEDRRNMAEGELEKRTKESLDALKSVKEQVSNPMEAQMTEKQDEVIPDGSIDSSFVPGQRQPSFHNNATGLSINQTNVKSPLDAFDNFDKIDTLNTNNNGDELSKIGENPFGEIRDISTLDKVA